MFSSSSSSSIVFTRLLPVALLLFAKITIQDYIRNTLEKLCFSLPYYHHNNYNYNTDDLLCSWFSLLTIDESKFQPSSAILSRQYFEWVFESSGINNKKSSSSSFFKYEELPLYLDFYITFMLIVGFVLCRQRQQPPQQHVKTNNNNNTTNTDTNIMSSFTALAFWCLLGSHAMGRRSTSNNSNYSAPLALCAVAIAVQHLFIGHRVESNPRSSEKKEKEKQKEASNNDSDSNNGNNNKRKGTVLLYTAKEIRELQVEESTALLGNFVLPFIGFVIWTFALLSGALVENVPLWLSSSFFLFLSLFRSSSSSSRSGDRNGEQEEEEEEEEDNEDIASTSTSAMLSTRRTISSFIAVFAASLTFFVLFHGVFFLPSSPLLAHDENDKSNNNNMLMIINNNNIWAVITHKLRSYGSSLDVVEREANWFPGSIVNELLIYGFRHPASAIIVFQTLLPWMLTIAMSMKLKMKFETGFLICALCDHRDNTLCHLAIFLLLLLNAIGKQQQQQQREQNRQSTTTTTTVFSPLRFMAGIYSIFTAVVSIFYFGSWSLHRVAQQNMSFYALFGTHLFGVIFMLFDHELEWQ